MVNIILNKGNVALDGERRFPKELPEALHDAEPSFRFASHGEDCSVWVCEERFDGYFYTPVRAAWSTLGDERWAMLAKGVELANWDDAVRHCARCGAALRRHTQISKICPHCGLETFAPMYPCVMVLVEDEEGRALLVHAANFRGPFYGLVAGFVETGETLEECVVREVREETGLEVGDIRYVASQSWPFPAQLMIGFRARKMGGTLTGGDGELSDARFFTHEDLPELASMPSLARRLIEAWKSEKDIKT